MQVGINKPDNYGPCPGGPKPDCRIAEYPLKAKKCSEGKKDEDFS
jgi:hypothetical protein